jgi:dihydroorotate dehydrogenase (NAD+) catalytic subunit
VVSALTGDAGLAAEQGFEQGAAPSAPKAATREREALPLPLPEPPATGDPCLAVDLGGLAMKNPLTVASGTFAAGREYAVIWQEACGEAAPSIPFASPLSLLGALTSKGVSLEPWAGNSGIRVAETASGLLNSIGLQNPGVEAFCSGDLTWLATQEVPVIVNVSGHAVGEYRAVIERLERERTVNAYEINISCPNVDCGGMSFGTSAREAERVTRVCREATARPLIVKLTPNVTDITEIARACEAGGADALTLINTVAGMAIDTRERKPVFDRVVAGLSGPAIKPVALYAVHRTYQAVSLPLIGVGGISSAEDVVEFLLAGATAVAIGTQNFCDPLAVPHILEGLMVWCSQQGVTDIHELTGALQ